MRMVHAFVVTVIVLSTFSSQALAGNPFKKGVKVAVAAAGAAAVTLFGQGRASAYPTPGGAGIQLQNGKNSLHVHGDGNGGAFDYQRGNFGAGGTAAIKGDEKKVFVSVGGRY